MSVLYKTLFGVVFIFCSYGSHQLSQNGSRIVPSAAEVLTIVFGMGTGVSPKRIATGNILFSSSFLDLKTKQYIKPLLISLERR